MDETIRLQDLFAVIKKRIVMIIIITVTGVGISGVISYLMITPEYEASTQLLVNQEVEGPSQQVDVNDLRSNVELINTYSVIMTSPAILDQVINELELNLTASQLQEQIEVSSEAESQVLALNVQDENPDMAIMKANTIAETFENEIPQIMNIDNVSILASAGGEQVESPVYPQPLLNMLIAFIVGAMAATGLSFLIEYFDNTLKDEHDVERELNLSVLGSLPEFTSSNANHQMPTFSKGEGKRAKKEVS